MAEYIDRRATIDAVQRHREGVLGGYEYDEGIAFGYAAAHRHIAEVLEKIPSADVQPVRHGHWETIEGWDGDELYRCSECGAEFVLIDGTPKDNDYWFCPHCGADMRGDQNED